METSPAHDLAGYGRQRIPECRTVVAQRVKLASLTARIDAGWQISEKRCVVLPAEKLRWQLLGVHAHDDSAGTLVDHAACSRRCVRGARPDRKERLDAGAGELPFAVRANICEKEIAECKMRLRARVAASMPRAIAC